MSEVYTLSFQVNYTLGILKDTEVSVKYTLGILKDTEEI
jgi:hypothetical protein